jgi:glycosyltransferase involved in cell wall biosynthesis
MKKLSVVISAFNEEKRLKECLDSLQHLDQVLEEIIVIDNTSTDRTKEIARKFTEKVFTVPNNLMLNKNKNFGFSKARTEWILNLDADERVTPELAQEIIKILALTSDTNGYWIPRKNIIFGKWIQNAIWWPDYQLRLFKREKGKFAEKHVHEYLSVEGETQNLTEPMKHLNYSSISQYIQKMDRIYTEDEVKNRISEGKKFNWTDAITLPIKDFLKTFFMQKGYRDGLHGLALSILQAFYTELIVLKMWEQSGFKEVNDRNFLKDVYNVARKLGFEIRYWFLSALIDESKGAVKKSYLRLLRKMTSRKINNT